MSFLALTPFVGVAGVLGDASAAGSWLVRTGALSLGWCSRALPLPFFSEVAARGAGLDPVRPPGAHHPGAVPAGRDVLTTWVIEDVDLRPFLEVMAELRVVRLRNLARRCAVPTSTTRTA